MDELAAGSKEHGIFGRKVSVKAEKILITDAMSMSSTSAQQGDPIPEEILSSMGDGTFKGKMETGTRIISLFRAEYYKVKKEEGEGEEDSGHF